MKQIITAYRIPIKLWLVDIDPQTLEKAKHLAELPNTVGHIAIMPDSHVGYGMPIGGVMATRDTMIPNGIGVDIGCGVFAVRASLRRLGVIHALRRKNDLDEAPGAYKDIDRVVALQPDLVDIDVRLRPLAVVKR